MSRIHIAVPFFVALAGGVVTQTAAQQRPPTEAEKALAGQINCEDFHRNPDGTWVSGPNAKIGTIPFSSSAFGPHAFGFGGADLATVLNQKCAGR